MTALLLNFLVGIFSSIGGSIVTALAIGRYNRWKNYKLQKLLGISFDKSKELLFVYARELRFKDNNPNIQRKETPTEQRGREHFTVSECEIRATNFLSTLLGPVARIDTEMKSHDQDIEKLDSTFISFGGPSTNFRTEQILNASENILVYNGFKEETSHGSQPQNPICMNRDDFTFVTGEPLHIDAQYDYGLILRITPTEHPNNAWLVCAGIGEWGTSGASWYLSKNWEKIMQKLDSRKYRIGIPTIQDFAVIIEVERGRDESARIIRAFTKQEGQAVEVDVS